MRQKISICIPTYNQKPEYLRASIQSSLQQRYHPLEIVVSDNHSTNDVPVVLSEFKDPRLKVVKPPVHLGMSQNFAFCASQSTGEYLNLLCSDDLLHPDFCMRLAAILDSHPNVAFAHAAVALINAEGRVIGYERSIHSSFVRSGLHELQRYVWHIKNVNTATLIRRTAYEESGGWSKDLDMVSDWYLSLLLLLVGDVAYRSDVLAYFRTWSTPERSRRRVAHIRDIRLLYERLESNEEIVSLIEGHKGTLHNARKKHALNWVVGLANGTLTKQEKEEIIREIKLLSYGFQVRAFLLLLRLGLGPLFSAWRRVGECMRQQVKSLLYPKEGR